MDWWVPEKGDLFTTFEHPDETMFLSAASSDICVYDGKVMTPLPLLQMHHLIAFIKVKTDSKVECCYDSPKLGYDIYIRNDKVGILCIFEKLGDDLLRCLWQVAREVA